MTMLLCARVWSGSCAPLVCEGRPLPLPQSSCSVRRRMARVAWCMPGLSGQGLQERLAAAGPRIPIIFITGHGDITMSVRAMKAGAVDFLPKPFNDQDL